VLPERLYIDQIFSSHRKRSLTPALTPCNSPPREPDRSSRNHEHPSKHAESVTRPRMHLSRQHDQARKIRPSHVAMLNRQDSSVLPSCFDRASQNADPRGSDVSTAWTPTKGEYEDSMTGSSLKSTSGYSSVTISPSYNETRSSREGDERRSSSLSHLVEKAQAKLSRRPSCTETAAKR